MTTLLRLALVAVTAACGAGSTPPAVAPAAGSATAPATDPASSALASQIEASFERMEEFKRAMCTCTDAPCADKVRADLDAWSEAVARTFPADLKLDDATNRRMTELATELVACADKAAAPAPAE